MCALTIIAVIFLCWLFLGGYLFFRACCRTKENSWLDREALSKTSFGKYSDAIEKNYNFLREHHAKDIWIQSEDGLKLHALWLEADDPVGTMLLAHGYRSTYLVDFSGAVTSYHAQGLNLLIPDQRSHGKSEGKYITFGVKESRDMILWLAYMRRELWNGPVILSGMSMGASTVMYMADEALPENVCGIIADCGFTSPAAIIGKVFTDVTHLPANPWMYSAEIFARVFAGFSLWGKNTVLSMSKARIPVFIAHGLDDDFVPCDMARVVYENCGGDKELLLVAGAGHGVSYLCDKAGYTACVRKLLRKAFGEAYELRNDKKL